MRAFSISMATMLLAACGGQESATNPVVSDNDGPAAPAPIMEQNDARPLATPQAGRSASPLAGPVAGESHPILTLVQTQPSSETRYRALGTEPFWAVTVKGSVATLERPDHAPMRFSISRHDDGRAVRYLADGFAMTASEGPCSDGMSDAVWSDRVAIAFGEGTLKGCGGVREDF